MRSQYHIDPEGISLKQFQASLKNRELIPSRALLKENLSDRFGALRSAGLETLNDVIDALKTKPKIEAFSKKHGLEIAYLTVLKREASAYLPNPVALSKFPGVDSRTVSALEKKGIKTSKHLFDRAATKDEMLSFPGIEQAALDELIGLSDLVRLYGVGPAFARMLFDIGITFSSAFLKYQPEEVVRLYEAVTKKKADFAAKDIEFAIEIAQHYLPGGR